MNASQNNPEQGSTLDGHRIARYERRILDTLPIGALITRISDGKVLFANPAGAHLLGYPDVAVLLNMQSPSFYWDSAERHLLLERFRAEGSLENYQVRFRRADDSMIWVSISVRAFEFEGEANAILSTIANITESKQMEEALHENEVRFRALYDNATVGLYRTTPDGKILMINPAGLRMMGFNTFEELAQRNLEESGFEEDDSRKEFSEKLEKDGVVSGLESKWIRKDGSTIIVSESSKAFRDENGKILYYDGSFEDITVRKQAEEAIIESQQKLSLLVDTSPLAIIEWNTNFEVVLWNPAAERIFGFSAEEARGRHAAGLIVPIETRSVVDDIWTNLFKQSGGISSTNENITKDGRTITCEWFNTLLIGADGKVLGVSSLAEDVTEQKQAEEELRRTKNIVETVPDFVAMAAPDGAIVYINPAGLAITGYTAEEFYGGMTIGDFQTLPREALETVAREGVWEGESEFVCKDGSRFPVSQVIAASKDKQGQIQYLTTVVRDITERKQSQLKLEREQLFSNTVINGLPGVFYMFDPQGKFLRWNENLEKTLGYSKQEMDEITVISLFPEDEQAFVLSRVQNVFVNGSAEVEANFLTKAGVKIPYYLTGLRMVIDESPYVVGIGVDITERKQAEQALQESQRLLQLVMDNIPQAVFWKDKGLTYLGTNQAFAEDAGFNSPQDLVGKTDFDMPWKEQAELYRADDQRILEIGEAKLNYEELQTGPTGDVTWLRTSKIPMRDINGKIFAVLGMYEDITEWKRLQQEVQAAFERRGYQVQVSTEIAQEVASASELNDLFGRVVTLTKERLGYYHAQMLRYDVAQDAVVLINGYGETGQKMLASGHKLPMGSGLIGTAASSGQTILRPTLTEDPDWQPNPLLPDTQGEIAVPIKFGEQILGVLDVQSDQAGALTEDDLLLLEGLCGQIAIAIHNTELVETIRENEAHLAEALKAARLGNWEYDFKHDLFQFSDQFYSIFRTTVEKVGGYKISSADYSKNFVHPDDAALVGSEIQKVLDAKDRFFTTHLEHRIIFSDGEVGYIAVNINVERDENGNITRWYGANQDITERKQAEVALRESELRYQQILDAITDMILVKGQKSSIVWANKSFRDYYGMTNEQLRDMIDAPIVEPDYTLQYIKDDAHVFESGEVLEIPEEPVTRYDGTIRSFETFKAPIRDLNGNVIMTVGVSRDITERIKEQENMAERLAEINRLYQSMSHEGWKTYRDTADLPAGFMFDQAVTSQVTDDSVLADELFANIPMKVLGGEVVGMLTVANDPLQPTSAEDRAFLQQVSEQIALALESARLTAQTQSALAQSENLFAASRRLAQVSDLQELVKITVEIFNIPAINGAELDMLNYDSAGELESLAVVGNWWNGTGTAPGAIGSRFSKEMFSAVQLFLTSTPVFINDALDSERVDASMLRIIKAYNIRAVTFLPLFVGTHQIGVLVMHAEEPHIFTEEETRLFSGLAPLIATVLENRRQYERAQKQAEREGMLNIISQKIQGATTVEAVLQIAARELGHALGAPMTIAQLGMKDKK